ncbi:MAG: right-handed parallel beta-helix repeat-containing protein [Bacteroidetes bacterium]|nr:right-handed parallel beta-helix repeat-containing protein [Bacteroidota bacterium]
MTRYIILLFLILPSLFAGTETRCRTAEEFLAALRMARPGSVIIVDSRELRLKELVVMELNGTAEAPVHIRAFERGKVKITGPTAFVLRRSSHVTIEGFTFVNDGSSAIRLEGCNNVRITRNTFRLNEQGRGSWVMVTGISGEAPEFSHHNTIDRNLFENKKELGNFVTIEGIKGASPAVSQYDVIEWNHFRNIGPRAENVLEAIRIGSSEFTLSRGHTVLQNNLFERCDGDPEYISIKLSDCIVRSNTFVECLGSLSLRHGNNSRVERNVIIGNGRTGTFLDSTGKTWTLGTGGIRFCADSMTIIGNYAEGLTGKEWDATVAVTNGDAEYGEGKPLTKHYRTRYTLLQDNIFVNNRSGIEIGFDGAGFQGNWWKIPPSFTTFRRNIIAGGTDTLVKFLSEPVATVFEGNIVLPYGNAVGASRTVPGITMGGLNLTRVDGFLLPKGSTPKQLQLVRLGPDDVGPDSK